MNTGEMEDYRTQLEESEELRVGIELELGAAQDTIIAVNERLDALSDWDNERVGLLDDIEALNNWITAAEGAIHFITINVNISIEPRILSIQAEPIDDGSFEIIWSNVSNEIENESQLTNDISDVLRDIVETNSIEKPTLIMFNHTGIRRQEFNLIDGIIKSFISHENTQHDISIYYSPYTNN